MPIKTSIHLGVTSSVNVRLTSQSCYPVITHDGKIYVFIVSALNGDVHYIKSSDGGKTWGIPVSMIVGVVLAVSVWYDRWTPGNSGDLIHMVCTDSSVPSDVFYRNVNASSDVLSTPQTTVLVGVSVVDGVGQCISITRAIGGNLYVAVDIDGGTENVFARSVDVGLNWTARTDMHEASSADFYLLAPGFAADTQDIICLFWDRSADEISRKIYDDSANTWAETSIATSMVDSATFVPNFAMTIDDLNNKILMVAWSATDLVNSDLRFFTIDETTITEGTNVVLNSTDDQGMCGISLDPTTNYIYVYYGGKSDGSETFATAIQIYYKISKDGGVTWGAETALSALATGWQWLLGCPILFWGGYPLALTEAAQAAQLLTTAPIIIHPTMKIGI